MTIKEVCQRYNITADTLRYYERAGVIPPVTRTAGGVRNYGEKDLAWVENALCLRNAGVSIEMIVEYVRLYRQGSSTYAARRELLLQAREALQAELLRQQQELLRLDYKISRYDLALETGELVWDRPAMYRPEPCECPDARTGKTP